MVNLNLLDPIHRSALARERLLLVIKDSAAMTLVATAFIAALLSMSKALLTHDLQEAAVRTNITSTRHQPIDKAIRELNIELQGVSQIINEYTAWSLWFSKFLSLVPPGNQLTDLTLNRQDRTFILEGNSRKRNDLLAFKQNLESSGLFKEIRFPLSNLLSRENIHFQFSATIDLSSLPPSPAPLP